MRTDNGRLIVTIPPQHGKTYVSIVLGASYFFSLFPDRQFIHVSYGDALACDNSLLARNAYREASLSDLGHAIGIPALADQESVKVWSNTAGGRFIATGIGGSITGKGCHFMAIDDPHKNQEEANSEILRSKFWRYWNSTLLTRVRSGGSILVILTRWHEDDFAGRLLNQGGWDLLRIPLYADTKDDPLERSIGQSLAIGEDPIFSEDDYKRKKSELDEVTFLSLYQQSPTAPGGNLFKQEDFQTFVKQGDKYLLSSGELMEAEKVPLKIFVDSAYKDAQDSDYFVALVAGITANKILVIDVVRKKVEGAYVSEEVRKVYNRYPVSSIYIEDKGSGTSSIQILKGAGLPVMELKAKGSKITRSETIRIRYKNKQVFHLDADWRRDFESELVQFPRGAHDDQVDAISYAGIHAADSLIPEEDFYDY